MGKGKGSVEEWVSIIRPGQVLYEIGGVSETKAITALKFVSWTNFKSLRWNLKLSIFLVSPIFKLKSFSMEKLWFNPINRIRNPKDKCDITLGKLKFFFLKRSIIDDKIKNNEEITIKLDIIL